MSNVTCNGYSDASTQIGWKNEGQWVNCVYDFSVDGGATADSFHLCKLPSGSIITEVVAWVKTGIKATAQTPSVTISLGTSLDVDALIDEVDATSIVSPSVLIKRLTTYVPSGAGQSIYMTVNVDALTAGKIDFALKYKKAS